MSEATFTLPTFLVYCVCFAAMALSLIVLVSKNPVVSAIALMGTLFCTAGIYFALGNYFLGAVQILVYAGAIAVLFVFIVMLLDIRPSLLRFIPGRKAYVISASVITGLFALFFLNSLLSVFTYLPLKAASLPTHQPTSHELAQFFVSKYQMAFQAAGLLIFGAILGAIVLARGHLGKEAAK